MRYFVGSFLGEGKWFVRVLCCGSRLSTSSTIGRRKVLGGTPCSCRDKCDDLVCCSVILES
jgi:hypothetical protein